jgi:hypothetical protein
MTAVSVAVYVAIALVQPPPPAEKTKGLTYDPAMREDESDLSWWRRPSVQGVGVLALTAATVVTFW